MTSGNKSIQTNIWWFFFLFKFKIPSRGGFIRNGQREMEVVEGGGNYHKRLIDLFCMAIVCQFGSFFFSFRQNPQQKYKAYHHLNISPSASSYNIENSSLFIVFWGPHRVNIDPDARRAQKKQKQNKTKSIESRKGGRNNHHHHYIYIPQDTGE